MILATESDRMMDGSELRERIQVWLACSGWEVEDQVQADCVWKLEAKRDGDPPVLVAQRKAPPGTVMLQIGIGVGNRFAGREEAALGNLLYEYRLGLTVFVGVEASGLSSRPLQQVRLSSTVCVEGMAAQDFFRALDTLRAAFANTVLFLDRAEGKPFPRQPIN